MNKLHEWAMRMAKAIAESVEEWEVNMNKARATVLPDVKIDVPMPEAKPPAEPPIMAKGEELEFCDVCETRTEVIVFRFPCAENGATECVCRGCLKKALGMLGEKA